VEPLGESCAGGGGSALGAESGGVREEGLDPAPFGSRIGNGARRKNRLPYGRGSVTRAESRSVESIRAELSSAESRSAESISAEGLISSDGSARGRSERN